MCKASQNFQKESIPRTTVTKLRAEIAVVLTFLPPMSQAQCHGDMWSQSHLQVSCL